MDLATEVLSKRIDLIQAVSIGSHTQDLRMYAKPLGRNGRLLRLWRWIPGRLTRGR